jgi:DedD protein
MIDRDLKERLIGAAILVLVVVLVVPVFLDGPSGDGELVNERVPLPGQSGQVNKTIVLERDRSSPVPSNAGNEPAAASSQTKQVVVEPEPQAKVAETTPEPVVAKPEPEQPAKQMPAAAPSTTGMWAVQLGSFGNKENAERLAADLRKQGFAAFLSQLSTSSGQLHRVRIGPQKDRESAEAMAERLAKAGHKGKVLPHP